MVGREISRRRLAREDSNLQRPDSKSGVLPIELRAMACIRTPTRGRGAASNLGVRPAAPEPDSNDDVIPEGRGDPVVHSRRAARVLGLMGSLIKKRRKRMRKKKHRKLLKRTRVQRRNKK